MVGATDGTVVPLVATSGALVGALVIALRGGGIDRRRRTACARELCAPGGGGRRTAPHAPRSG